MKLLQEKQAINSNNKYPNFSNKEVLQVKINLLNNNIKIIKITSIK